MKLPQITSKPGFELVFALSIAAIFIIPSVVMAQTSESTEIIITNGDTVINGKNIKTLSPAERAQAVADMQKLKGSRKKVLITDVVITPPPPRGMPGQPPMIANDGMAHQYGDYVGGGRVDRPLHLKKLNTDSSTTTVYQFRTDDGTPPPMPPLTGMNDGRPRVEFFRRDGMRGNGRSRGDLAIKYNSRNSQRFSYSNTDANGTSTNINYSVTEPWEEDTNADDKKALTITDIKLVPDFSTGKTTLSFSLPAKAAAEVEFINSEDKTLWSERGAGASFSRSFALPLNGMYKLKVKQGGKTVIKNIMKEE